MQGAQKKLGIREYGVALGRQAAGGGAGQHPQDQAVAYPLFRLLSPEWMSFSISAIQSQDFTRITIASKVITS